MHKNLPQLYRVLFEAEINGDLVNFEFSPPALATSTSEHLSDIQDYCRLSIGVAQGILSYTDKNNNIQSSRENKVGYADGSFFDIFDFPVWKGDASGLKKPNQVAISRTYSEKFFGRENPIGKTLTMFNQFGQTKYTVAVVFEDMPQNSDIQLEVLLSLQTLANPENLGTAGWASLDSFDSSYMTTYLLLNKKADPNVVAKQMNELKNKLKPDEEAEVKLQSAENIHLGTSLTDRYATSGSLAFVYIMAIVGVLILSIAWLNYVNLSTAISLKRAKEVGIRKVVGANRNQLIFQFMGESFLFNFLGVIFAIVMIEVFQGFFNEMTGKQLSLSILGQGGFWFWGIAFIFSGAFLSGAYTAFNLSSFQPVKILKGVFTRTAKGLKMRKVLVVFQFSISIALIASTFILYKQLNYMRDTSLGMNPNQLLVISGPEVAIDTTLGSKKEIFSQKLRALPFIEKFSLTGTIPSSWYNFNTGGITKSNPKPEDDKKSYAMNIIDHRYLNTYEIPLAAGQNFNESDCKKGFNAVDKVLINEKASQTLGFASPESAVNQTIKWGERSLKVQGVLKDYHHQALQSQIEAMIFIPQINTRYFTLKIHTQNIQENIQTLQKIYQEYFPGNPFEHFFMDEQFNQQYNDEVRYSRIFTSASLLAILIACLGLFGLAAFTVEQRTKEIGIRKVMGASIQSIIKLVTQDFLKLVVIAFIIAIPFSWYFSNRWLQDFAYKTTMSWWVFILAGGIAIFIAFLTIVWHSFRAASANPVEVLRNE